MKTLLWLAMVVLGSTTAHAEWIFLPSYYTHRNGERVCQYSLPAPSYARGEAVYEGGYRHQYFQNGSDYMHVIEAWGWPPYYVPPYFGPRVPWWQP
jgi:hypothetical protein